MSAIPPRTPALSSTSAAPAARTPLPLSEQAAMLAGDSAVLSGPTRSAQPRSIGLVPNRPAAEPTTAVPLHRRVKIEGLSGRFLRAVISALAGNTAGSAHILIDVSLTPTQSQLDARALATMLQSISSLFGLSCDLLVCHAQTTSVDFSHGALIAGQPSRSAQRQGSFSVGPAAGYSSLAPQSSPELRPASQFPRNPPPPDLQLPATVDSEDELTESDDVSAPPLDEVSEQNDGNEDDAAAESSIPQPPPLPTHLHAPRRQHATADLAFDASSSYRDADRAHRRADSSLLPYEHPPMLLQQSSYHMPPPSGDITDTWYDAANASAADSFDGGRKLRLVDSFSPISPTGDNLGAVYSRGPIFSNIFIAHHIHNASKEVQDVLLQALKLKQIVVDGLPVNLPAIHLCIATHSQTVRHAHSALSPRLQDEFVMDIMAEPTFFQSFAHFLHVVEPRLQPHLPIPWEAIKQLVNQDESSAGIYLSHHMGQYIRDITIALRQHGRVAFGPSPQGMKAFIHAAKCHAFFGGCNFVRPVDIDSVAEDSLCHRLMLRAAIGPWSKPHSARLLINHMIGKVLLPPK